MWMLVRGEEENVKCGSEVTVSFAGDSVLLDRLISSGALQLLLFISLAVLQKASKQGIAHIYLSKYTCM